MYFFLSFGVLGVLVPAAALVEIPDTGRSRAWVIAVVVIVWAGLRLSLLISAGQARFFAFFFWLFTYIFMGITPVVQIRSDRPSFTTPDVLPSLDLLTMWTVVLGLACFEVGTVLVRVRRAHPPRTAPEMVEVDVRPLVATGLALMGLTVSAYYISQVGVEALLTSREAAASARARVWPDVPTRAAVISLAIYLTLLGTGALTQLRRLERRRVVRLGYLALVTAGVAGLTLVAFPVSSPRFTVGTVAFALLVLFGAAASSARVRLTLVGTVFGLFFLFPLADAFRTSEVNYARAGLFQEYAGNADYDSVWQIANALTFWSSGNAEVGRQALGIALFWVPRAIWADKPLDTGVELALLKGYSTTNLSAPLWAEALANGGLIAVALVFVGLGLLLRNLDNRVISALPTGGLWALVGAVFPGYFVILMRGSLLQAVGVVAIVGVCLVALKSPRPKRLPAG